MTMAKIDTSKREKSTYLMLVPVPLVTLLWAALVTFLAAKFFPIWGSLAAGVVASPLLTAATFAGTLALINHLFNVSHFDSMVEGFNRLDIPKETREAAIACFKEAGELDAKARIYSYLAPVVMFFVLPFLNNKDARLPKWLHKFDNDVSRYGDGEGIVRDGVWHDTRQEGLNVQPGETRVQHNDPAYGGDSYYAPGFWVRGFVAQYIWMGWRNTASQANLDLAIKLNSRPELVYGIGDSGTRKEGFGLYKYNDKYQYMAHTRKKLLGYDVVIRSNVGYKLNLAINRALNDLRGAQPVFIVWSFKRWKGAK